MSVSEFELYGCKKNTEPDERNNNKTSKIWKEKKTAAQIYMYIIYSTHKPITISLLFPLNELYLLFPEYRV